LYDKVRGRPAGVATDDSMSAPSPKTPSPTPNADSRGARPPRMPLLEWLPWEKVLIWGLFLLLVYTLRHFFFIIFMTFILAYVMRSVVRRVMKIFGIRDERVWLERALAVAGFALLLFGLYSAGDFLAPQIYRQGEALVSRVTQIDPPRELNSVLERTVGAYLFRREYGQQGDPAYEKAFEEFSARGPSASATRFPEQMEAIEKRFESEQNLRIRDEIRRRGTGDTLWKAWFLRDKAPELIAKNRDALVAEWEKIYRDSLLLGGESERLPLEELKKAPDFEERRDEQVRHLVFAKVERDPEQRDAYRREWEDYLAQAAITTLRGTPGWERRFGDFYESLRREDPSPLPDGRPTWDYDTYVALAAAYREGEAAFTAKLRETMPSSDEERVVKAHELFETERRRSLVDEWSQGTTYIRLKEAVSGYAESGLKALAEGIRGAIGQLVTLPVQFALSLLLSLFITFDIPRLKRGVLRLRRSRVSDFFDEIAPGLYNFGRLIGRAFQAQGVIAIFNTVLTFIAIRLLSIQNEVFLCAIVFVCSFIPVLGVVLSSAPIAVVAIVQPGGSIFLALQAVAAILVIHFIETSVLNPKILGDMLHLHPVVVLAVLAVGEHFFGVWGLLLAVPVTVFIIRGVILHEGIPGLIEDDPITALEKEVEEPPPLPARAAPSPQQPKAPAAG